MTFALFENTLPCVKKAGGYLKKNGSIFAALVIWSFCLFGSVSPEETKAEAIIRRCMAQMGGQEAFDEVRTLYLKRILDHLEEQRKAVQISWMKRPGWERSTTEGSPRPGIIITPDGVFVGTNLDKKTTWTKRPSLNKASLFGKLLPFVDYRDRGMRARYLETIDQEGTTLDLVELIHAEGLKEILYFDNRSGLLAGFRPDPSTYVEKKGYKQFGKLLLPTVSIGRGTLNGKQWHHIDTVQDLILNVDMDASIFATE